MHQITNKLINASALLGTYTAIGYAYGLVGKLPAEQVAVAWLIWGAANIAIQCFVNTFLNQSSEIKNNALALLDIAGLIALAKAGLMGSALMGTALIICTVIARGFNILINFSCECCSPGPRFTMDIIGYEKPYIDW